MFWNDPERETSQRRPKVSGPLADPSVAPTARPLAETVVLERNAPRAASITRVAEELNRRGEEVVELFKEVISPVGQAVLPIYLRRNGEDVFFEVETGPWGRDTVENVLRSAAVIRGSEHSGAAFEVLGAYPLPEGVRYFCGQWPLALFQLDLLLRSDPEKPTACAEVFKEVAERHWGSNLDYDPEGLTLIEELLLEALGEGGGGGKSAPILDALVRGYGCYVGEVLRRYATLESSWRSAGDWGEGLALEFPAVTADPIGKARAFLENGPEDSAAYYVAYAIEELNYPRER
jgi:hypothetical protein